MNFSFTEPWWRGTRTSVGFDLYNTSQWYEDFDRASQGINLRMGRPVQRYDYTRLNLSYRFELVDIKDVDNDASIAIQDQEGKSTTGAVTASLVRDSRDDRFNTRSGSYSSITTEMAGIGGSNQFMGMILSSAKYFPLRWNTVFMVRGTIGYLFGYGGEDVPISDKFFLGGIDSMRGFEDRTVAPHKKRKNNNNRIYFKNGIPYYNPDYDPEDNDDDE